MNKCPDFVPDDFLAGLPAHVSDVADDILPWDAVRTPVVDIVTALDDDRSHAEMGVDSDFLAIALNGLRESGIAEGDISAAAITAMEFTGIDRLEEI